MLSLPRRLVIAGVVALVFFATPAAYGLVVEGQHPRDESDYIDALAGFRCSLAGCKPQMDGSMRRDLKQDPRPFIVAGDKACDWLEEKDSHALWFGPRPEELSEAYREEKFGKHDTSRGVPDPSLSGQEVWAEVFYSDQARQAWTHLCGEALAARTTWPTTDWYEGDDVGD